MFSNRLTFAALAVACVAAAGAGGYFATRQNAVPAPAAAMAAPIATSADHPAQESEAVSGDGRAQPAVDRQTSDAPNAATSATMQAAKPARAVTTRAPQSARAAAQQPPATQDKSPASATVAQTPAPVPLPAPVAAAPDQAPARIDDRPALPDIARAPEPPEKTFEEIVVSANSVIGLQTETRLSSETARVEDRVEAKVTRDVKVGDHIAIPAGSRAIGSVMQVERGGKFKERARIGIRFTTLVLADGTRLPISTETIYREGEAPGNSSAAKIGGGAVAGTILGAILGGAKGAAIGATAGAGGGAAAVEAGDRQPVTLPSGSPLTARLLTPVTVTIEQK